MTRFRFNPRALPIPLRHNLTVHILDLPKDLSKLEAQKICAIVVALVEDS
jgi:hypothetical protein